MEDGFLENPSGNKWPNNFFCSWNKHLQKSRSCLYIESYVENSKMKTNFELPTGKWWFGTCANQVPLAHFFLPFPENRGQNGFFEKKLCFQRCSNPQKIGYDKISCFYTFAKKNWVRDQFCCKENHFSKKNAVSTFFSHTFRIFKKFQS